MVQGSVQYLSAVSYCNVNSNSEYKLKKKKKIKLGKMNIQHRSCKWKAVEAKWPLHSAFNLVTQYFAITKYRAHTGSS